MNFRNVTVHKDKLILKHPVFFSEKLCDFLDSKKGEYPLIFYSTLASMPLGIWAQKIEGSEAEIVFFFIENSIMKTDQILVFSAELNNETCIVCIEDIEILNFSEELRKKSKNPVFISDTIFTSFKKLDDILLLNPFLKKSKKSLKSFFDEAQAIVILHEFEGNMQAGMN